MAEYISREAALDLLKLVEYKESSINFAGVMIRELREMPAADVRPVVRGEWVADRYGGTTCSVCGLSPDENRVDNADDWGRWEPFPPFCPNCGANMREVEHEI